ncbi:hypothetical protein HDU93_004243 [Gonapodya sp. JEL0774]|nr:hypothetical protein HDU93_004243 [Gonapodya sp. JEL0774]
MNTSSAAVSAGVKRRGALIVVEGVDRSGKSTQCKLLVDALRKRTGTTTELIRFPDRTTVVGQTINSYLQQSSELDDRAIHLLFSANRWEAMNRMKCQLQNGTNLIVDRYAYSGVAFSVAKGLDPTWCGYPDRGLLRPDLILFLDLTAEAGASRPGFGGERYENIDMQEKVREIFREMQSAGSWEIIDAKRSIDVIHADILRLAEAAVEACGSQPLREDLFYE